MNNTHLKTRYLIVSHFGTVKRKIEENLFHGLYIDIIRTSEVRIRPEMIKIEKKVTKYGWRGNRNQIGQAHTKIIVTHPIHL